MSEEIKSHNLDKRSSGVGGSSLPPGPYVAEVVNHLDNKRQGSLRVQVLSNILSGNDSGIAGQLFTVRYCMPFYGVNSVTSNQKNNDYYSTQQSYGFWAVPPDPGTKVHVMFAEGSHILIRLGLGDQQLGCAVLNVA